MTLAVCPGSFDPPTNGHIDVIERASRHFERVLVAVVGNPGKQSLLDPKERVALLEEALAHLPKVSVEAYEGLLVNLVRDRGASVILKGLRNTSDTPYELQMATINATLLPAADTMFVVSSPQWSFVSSSMVKEVARYGGDVSSFVPEGVARALARCYGTAIDG